MSVAASLLAYPDRACAICGAMFAPKRRNQSCCSDDCRMKLYMRQRADWRLRNRPALEKRLCKACGSEFAPKRKNQMCCSPECQHEYHKWQCRENSLRYYYQQKAETTA